MTKRISAVVLGLLFIFTTACVQMPTERQGVVDLRPQISFVASQPHHDAQVFVDNAEVGRVGDFIEGSAALRIVPGTHVVKVISRDAVLMEERFYVADGVSRAFVLR
jgi:hypothetical protein